MLNIDIIDKIKQIIIEPKLQEMIASKEFYYKRAVDKYNEYLKFNISKESINNINEDIESMGKTFNFIKLLELYKVESEEYRFLKIIGELVAYIDSKAANKNIYNQYEDKRVIANPFIRQNIWVQSLIKYKVDNNIDNFTLIMKNCLNYIINPKENINIVSPKHRMLISLLLFNKSEYENDFYEIIKEGFKQFKINPENEENLSTIYSYILYSDEIRRIWDSDKKIWKVSHGNNGEFTIKQKEEYIKKRLISVEETTGKGQGSDFIEKAQIGDYFYLCYGSRVVLLGVIASDAQKSQDEKRKTWRERRYILLKNSKTDKKYDDIKKGWSPNYNSTFKQVSDNDLGLFEQKILMPYFNITLKDLNDENIEYDQNVNNNNTQEVNNTMKRLNNNKNLNIILYGPPGTGKTYNCINYAVSFIEGNDVELIKEMPYKNIREKYSKYIENEQVIFTTFHQSYGYEEFIEAIKPCIKRENEDTNTNVSYMLEDGIFKKISKNAMDNPDKNYVIIIDEINRGNISKIFGELITLVEPTKRIGMYEETFVTLPYSKEKFGVPSNLYIIGTMNTADRSIALMDIALRRRFKFIEMQPNYNILKKLNDNEEFVVNDINIKDMMNTINKRIEILYDREHTIGQAYLMELLNDKDMCKLGDIFENKIIPLIQEYFYDDYEKIRLILADNQVNNRDMQFIIKESISRDLFGNDDLADYLEENSTYH
ncbi:McrB family protein, partial [Clostridium novyi]|uniref:McrB family protein n=1 Tax=Clostridium novyi TaxID=1542 RepID=UPI00068FE695